MDQTRALSEFAAGLRAEMLSAETKEQTAMFIADYCAACIAGYRVNESFNSALAAVLEEEGGAGQSSVLFADKKYPASSAAWMNAAYAHGADMDDGNRRAAGHIGAHVLSAVFAVAEQRGSSWAEVITAINVGYEVFNRLAGAAMPGLYNKGFHSTGVAGAAACAAACAKLRGEDADGIYAAISLAAVQSGGLIIIDESGQSCKPINPANAARLGVLSASIASRHKDAPKDPLQSKKGWFNAFSTEPDIDSISDGLGERFTINESYLKLYPACRHTHTVIEAASEIRKMLQEEGADTASVTEINVKIYPAAIRSTGGIAYPESADEAKFSLKYCLVKALELGGFGFGELSVTISEEEKRLADCIILIEDTAYEDRKKGIRGTAVEVVLADGRRFSSEVLIPKGEGEKRLSWTDMKEKMLSCAIGTVSAGEAEGLVDRIRGIDFASEKFSWPLAGINKEY